MADTNNYAWDEVQHEALTESSLDGLPSVRPTWAGSFLCASYENDACYAPEVTRAAKRLVWMTAGLILTTAREVEAFVANGGWD